MRYGPWRIGFDCPECGGEGVLTARDERGPTVKWPCDCTKSSRQVAEDSIEAAKRGDSWVRPTSTRAKDGR